MGVLCCLYKVAPGEGVWGCVFWWRRDFGVIWGKDEAGVRRCFAGAGILDVCPCFVDG